MRGYFGLGVEGLSKSHNAGALFRTAHAFGASFLFAIAPSVNVREIHQADTSGSDGHVPLFQHEGVADLSLPRGCRLVGVELTEDAVDLPSFRHPERAAYVLGPERGSLSPELAERCDFVVKIPTAFCVNVSVAGAIVLYDRAVSRGRWAERPVRPGGGMAPPAPHVHGGRIVRTAI